MTDVSAGLIAVSVMLAIILGVKGMSALYRKISRNGRTLREDELPKEIYEVLFYGEMKGDIVFFLRNAKGEKLSCELRGNKEFNDFRIVGDPIDGCFLAPKKANKKSLELLPTPEQ